MNRRVGSRSLPSIDERITVAMISMNEEEAVGKVIGDIKAALPAAEVVLVDSSDDRTPEIARALGARVIRQHPPRGYGRAMNLALRSNEREVVVTMDCDDTYPVDQIETLARLVLEEGYDVVDGNRLRSKPTAMRTINYLGNWIFAMFASILFFKRFRDLHSGMRAYKRGVPERLEYNLNGAAQPVHLLLLPHKSGMKVGFVDIAYRVRLGESVMNPLETSLWTARRILTARFRRIAPSMPSASSARGRNRRR